jgi:hypothetical protein
MPEILVNSDVGDGKQPFEFGRGEQKNLTQETSSLGSQSLEST